MYKIALLSGLYVLRDMSFIIELCRTNPLNLYALSFILLFI